MFTGLRWETLHSERAKWLTLTMPVSPPLPERPIFFHGICALLHVWYLRFLELIFLESTQDLLSIFV
jgi:hypothetical protein